MSRLSRRVFLRTGLAGTAGALTVSPVFAAAERSFDQSNIIHRTLGKTKLKVPVVSFGVMRADNPALCKAAYDSGIKLFDTANGYQNGNNERMLGALLRDLPRDSFIIETKVKAAGLDRNGLPSAQTTPEDFIGKFNESLSRLQMDYVDLLFIHDVSNPELLEYKPLINALLRLKKQKKARFIGFSTHSNMAAVINAAADSEIWDAILTSYNFKVEDIHYLDAALNKANNAGLGIIAMKTLAGGGFLDKERTKPLNTTAAIKWALSNKNVHTAIPGMTTFDHLAANLGILENITMTEKEKQDLLYAQGETGMYCTGCTGCLPQCPYNLPVPDLMRAYMYAYGYSNIPMAYSLLGELGTGSAPCINCDSCKITCTKNFNLKEKISDVSRLVNTPADFII